ncbi:hypothetical protein [Phytohabitans suffuscus]
MAVAGLGCDEGLKLGSLGFQTERLVVLVGGAADVDRDAAHAAAFDLPNVTGAARFLAHGYHPHDQYGFGSSNVAPSGTVVKSP